MYLGLTHKKYFDSFVNVCVDEKGVFLCPKKIYPPDANEEEKFRIIMEGLLEDDRMMPPKEGRVGVKEKWRSVAEKENGVTSGYIVSKNATSGTAKHEHRWMYKFFTDQSGQVGKFFYAMFAEMIGGELFRYVLGDAAPKIRLITTNTPAPGVVSCFLPEFVSIKEYLERPYHE